MQKKIIIGVIVILVILAAALGIANRSKSKAAADGLNISAGGKEVTVSWEEIGKEAFSGELVNGKGEVSQHDYEGAELAQILQKAGVEITAESVITAGSEDNYTAELSGSELLEAGKVYVALTADGKMIEGIEGGQGAQLIVFGDPNSKRAVRYLKTITVE